MTKIKFIPKETLINDKWIPINGGDNDVSRMHGWKKSVKSIENTPDGSIKVIWKDKTIAFFKGLFSVEP